MREASSGRLTPASRLLAAITTTDGQMVAEEALDDRVVRDPPGTSFDKDSAQVDHRVPVVPARSLCVPALAQDQDESKSFLAERCVLPPHVENTVPICAVHLHLRGSSLEMEH